MTRRIAVAVIVAVVAAGLGATPRPAAASIGCTNPFPASYAADLARRYPGVRITAAVADTTTGCWYHLRPGLVVTTASVMKAQVLGALLLQAQQQGRALTAWERAKVDRMIRYSFNPETTELYGHVGSVAAMEASDPAFGATSTTHTARYGLTRSTAADRTRLALRLLHSGGPLTDASRDVARSFMETVHPMQEWGISAGVPEGWTVAQKNGFYPASGLGWRLGSSGFVRRDDADEGYAATVMVEGAATEAQGIAIVEEVSRRVAAHLTVGAPADRPWDRRRCLATRSGESWYAAAARLGIASRAADVRTVAGGNVSPMRGQVACNPSPRAETISTRSRINGRYQPVVCRSRRRRRRATSSGTAGAPPPIVGGPAGPTGSRRCRSRSPSTPSRWPATSTATVPTTSSGTAPVRDPTRSGSAARRPQVRRAPSTCPTPSPSPAISTATAAPTCSCTGPVPPPTRSGSPARVAGPSIGPRSG